MNQILNKKELVGKTISETLQTSQEFWIKFTDDSFVVLQIINNTEGFGYTNTIIDVSDWIVNTTNNDLVKLGLISQEVYEEACQEEEEEYERERQKRERELYEQQELENEIRERELYEQLKKKFDESK
jgi:hypothetical protein